MVVFVDFEDEDHEPPVDLRHEKPALPAGFPARHSSFYTNGRLVGKPEATATGPNAGVPAPPDRPNPNLNSVSEALGCYPIISLLASYIDRNTLHALSRTCRQVRANLIQYRHQLVHQTLRCVNEIHDEERLETTLPLPDVERWHMFDEPGHLTSGKVSSCARDLVSDCRRCGSIVCRNCIRKPPSTPRLPLRLRRLCPTCLSAPLSVLAPRGHQDLCSCADAVHLCVPCGHKLAEADTQYERVWNWRTRYTTFLGGVGVGVGEGNEGSKCARGASCLGAMEVEVELDCPTSFTPSPTMSPDGAASVHSASGSSSDSEGAGTPIKENEDAGYWRQEIEGLGGVVKKKFRKREKVGGTVREWEEEMRGGKFLMREKCGKERSWCGWCGRAVAAQDESQLVSTF